tara:strand:+ start:406 stop:513 length:108 start_codon:yes stop_codon:yes gene_type:complete
MIFQMRTRRGESATTVVLDDDKEIHKIRMDVDNNA